MSIGIQQLEMHVTHACNLSCQSCSHYSDHGHRGMIPLDDADRWMSQWSERLSPGLFTLLGGEPALHPQLSEFITLSRRHWPRARLQLVTNGFFLHRHPELPRVLANDPDIRLSLSIHHNSSAYRKRLLPILAMLIEWKREAGIRVDLRSSFNNWTKRYHGYGADMEPFEDGQPRESWENCPARLCRQLYQGKLWKCPPVAYLPMQHEKFGLSQKWNHYLNYRALEPECTDEELEAFLGLEDESYCGMCPAKPQYLQMADPMRRPSLRQRNAS